MKHFQAPWSALLIIHSVLASLLCLAIPFWGFRALATKQIAGSGLWFCVVPLAVVFGSALFTIRGYTVLPDAILVHRLLWATRLPRGGLAAATFDPEAMRWSLRAFGNGGLFSFSGFYWNRRLGAYRVFVTDPRRAVVLRYSNRTVVVSPSYPVDFANELGAAG
jgi:hypothetical protein